MNNPSLGQSDFDQDLYECTRQVKLHPEWRSPRDMPSATLDPFEGYAEECLPLATRSAIAALGELR